jgi:sulfate permease, SulP family
MQVRPFVFFHTCDRRDQTLARIVCHVSRLTFHPKLLTVLVEGYRVGNLKADMQAGLTVAIVALPLSMAIAIASHAKPEAGLFTAIIGGFIISALGGSRFQIGGPAGAFIVLVASIIDRHGMDGLLLATIMAGIFIVAAGLCRLGRLVEHVPHAVVVGFTAGIAVIIFASQLRDLFGLHFVGLEPGELLQKLSALYAVRASMNVQAIALSVFAITLIVGQRLWFPKVPGLLLAVVLSALIAWFSGLHVETIGTRFGGIPHGLPFPQIPAFDRAKLIAVLPDAASLALLGSIESLLSAVVADRMAGRKHRSNTELIAQGLANVGSALFGGLTATGTIARTATNVRAGAHGPMSGIFHSLFLLLFMLVAAPLMSFIPLAALAGVLAVVAWNMVERPAISEIVKSSWRGTLVLLVTFLLTIFRDLITGIAIGIIVHLAMGLAISHLKKAEVKR